MSGQSYDNLSVSKYGLNWDGARCITVDRAFACTGGMNSTLRDAARFALMIKNEGKVNNKQLIPSAWLTQL